MVVERPFISQKSVQQALDSMLFGKPSDQPNPLDNLMIVEDALSDPAIPDMENIRRFALHRLLIDLLRAEFVSQCHLHDFEGPVDRESRAQAFRSIKRLSSLQIPELIGWSLLYYRHVRADLNIQLSDLLEVISVDVRTLRRYQSGAVKKLSALIALREWKARQEKHRRYLYSQLPFALNERIWGRDTLMQHVHKIIANNAPVHLLITGPEGIGKTSFAQVLVQGLIDAGTIDQLVWLTRPPSASLVRRFLEQRFHSSSQMSLKEYTLLNYTIVVLDDISLLPDSDDQAAVDNLLKELGNALVVMTNRIYRQFGTHYNHIVLPELDEQDVISIVKAARPEFQHNQDELRVFTAKLYDLVGGNPLAVKLAAYKLANIDLRQPLFDEGGDLIYRLVLSSYNEVSHNAQTLLLMFALMPPKLTGMRHLSSLWVASEITDDDIVTLLSCGLIVHNSNNDEYILPDAVRRFVRWLYSQSPSVKTRIETLIGKLTNQPSDAVSSETAKYILLQEWVNIDVAQQQRLADSAVSEGVASGHYAEWSTILERIVPVVDSPNLKLYYAMCLRQLAEFSNAETLFREAIRSLGDTGDFEQQSRGMIELGILMRQQGLYEKAVTLIDQVRSLAMAWHDQELLHKAELETAQILIDSGNIKALKATIADLAIHGADDGKAMLLLSEAFLYLNDFDGAKLYAERAQVRVSGPNLGRVYALLGRIATQQKDFDGAQDWFSLSISLLEQSKDWYGLARVKSNLAAAFIQQHQYLDDAEELLLQAQTTQRKLSDRAGMIYTTHNIEMLNKIKWIDET